MRAPANTRTLAVLLTFVVVLQFGAPVTQYGDGWTSAYMLAYAAMAFFGILVAREEDESLLPVALPGVAFVVAGVWFSFHQDSTAASVTMLATVATFMFALMISLMRFTFRHRETAGIDLVMAAVATYLILGGFFAALLALTEIASPGSFADPQLAEGPLGWERLLYFSYVSLATLGYGDILPLTLWARSLATLEAVTGTLFLTVVMARLVSIWTTKVARQDSRG